MTNHVWWRSRHAPPLLILQAIAMIGAEFCSLFLGILAGVSGHNVAAWSFAGLSVICMVTSGVLIGRAFR